VKRSCLRTMRFRSRNVCACEMDGRWQMNELAIVMLNAERVEISAGIEEIVCR
jgi:hypothetical protein